MKEKILNTLRHPLILSSSIILIGSMITNILSYLFNLVMGRLLIPSDYGILISLTSIFNIFGVFSITISTVFAKFAASYVGQKKEHLVRTLFVSGSMWVGILSFLISGAIIIFSPYISNFLNLNSLSFIIIVSIVLFFSFLSSVGNGILQGLLKFGYFSFLNIFSSLIKLVLGVVFVFLGWKIFGVLNSILISALIAYVLVFFPILRFFNKSNKNSYIPNFLKKLSLYAIPVFLSTIGMTVFTTIDTILVKHFFSPLAAGQYSALSIMGRSIFFVVSPIFMVFFPLVAQKYEKKEKLTNIVFFTMIIIGIPLLILTIIYFIVPKLVLQIFFPAKEYSLLAPYLGHFAIFIVFYAFSYILNIFYLSIGKIKVCIFTILAAFLEGVLIWFFHSDINQIINNLIISSFLLLCALLWYYQRVTKFLHKISENDLPK